MLLEGLLSEAVLEPIAPDWLLGCVVVVTVVVVVLGAVALWVVEDDCGVLWLALAPTEA